MFYLSFLLGLTQHEDTGDVVFPHHPPEVIHSWLQWTLGQDVLVSVLITLREGEEGERGASRTFSKLHST